MTPSSWRGACEVKLRLTLGFIAVICYVLSYLRLSTYSGDAVTHAVANIVDWLVTGCIVAKQLDG